MTYTDDRPAGAPAAVGQAPASTTHPADALTREQAAVTAKPAAAAAAPPAVQSRWEQCDHCQAPVDPAQRYCVQCGTSQRRSDDPVSRYFASVRRPKRVAVAAPSSSRTIPVTVAAVLIALLPVAAGIGIVVGRGSTDSGQQVIEALKAAKLSQGAVVAGTAAGAATTQDAAASTKDASSKSNKAVAGKKVDGIETSTKQAKVSSTGARQLDGYKPTEKDLADSKKAVEQVNSSKGAEYIETTRDLPDVITIP
jgi:hypothetical protein